MPIDISFGGASINRPGAYSTVDSNGMVPVTLGSLKVLAVVGMPGNSNTLLPGTVAYFNDEKLAALAVGEGETLETMRVAWRHGADLIAVSLAAVTAPATAPTDIQWQSAIDLLRPEFISGIIPVSVTPVIQTKVLTHIAAMSTVSTRRRRRGFFGHDIGKTATEVAALATPFASERAVLATPAPQVANSLGAKVSKPGYYMAAAFAGLWASQPSQEPITYKNVKFDGLDRVYEPNEIATLLTAHVSPVEMVKNVGFRIVQGVTTSPSPDLTAAELSVSTLKDDMSENLESYFEAKYVGHAGVSGIEVTMYNDLVSILEQFVSNGWISGYVQEAVKVTKNGTAFTLDWEGKPTLPINNFLITSHFKL